MSNPLGPLLVDADLRLEVDDLRAQITAHGQQIEVVTRHPLRLALASARALRAAGGLRSGRALVSRSRETGLTIAVSGRSGPILRVGPDAGPARIQLRGVPRITAAALGVAVMIVAAVIRQRGRRGGRS